MHQETSDRVHFFTALQPSGEKLRIHPALVGNFYFLQSRESPRCNGPFPPKANDVIGQLEGTRKVRLPNWDFATVLTRSPFENNIFSFERTRSLLRWAYVTGGPVR